MIFFDPNRVAIIVNSLLVHAGVESRTIELAKHLLGKGCEVDVVVLRQSGKMAEAFARAGAAVRFIHVYDYRADDSYRFHPLGWLRLCWTLLLRRYGSIICVQTPSSLVAAFAAFPPLGRRLITMERFLITGRSPRRRLLDRLLSFWTYRIVCVSTLLRDQLRSLCGVAESKIVVIEDGVAVEPIEEEQVRLKEEIRARFTFGCVGLLTQRKRPALLLEAFRLVLDQLGAEAAFLCIVGTGEDEDALRRLAERLQITKNVAFTGEQAHPHDFYPLFDVFAFPSVREGLGNVWVEAMLHGIPVLCADVPPMSDYVSHEANGLLFRADEAAALSEAMIRLFRDRDLRARLGAAGQEFARSKFDRETQLEKLESLIRRKEH